MKLITSTFITRNAFTNHSKRMMIKNDLGIWVRNEMRKW